MYKIRENETKLDYMKRLILGKLKHKTIDLDYKTLSSMIFGKELAEDECRKRMYGALELIEQMEKTQIENITDSEILDKLTLKELEIDKKMKKNQTIRTEINKNMRLIARNEMTQDSIKEAISNLEPMTIEPVEAHVHGNKQGVLPISDIHFGKFCEIKGLDGKVINKYDENIFKLRMTRLLTETINICEREEFEKLNVLLTGDLIDGILRMTQLQRLQYGIIDSTMKLAEYLATFLNELSQYIPIDVHCCLGNHSQIRPLGSQNGDFSEENMERIILWFLQSRLESNKRINIKSNDGEFIYFNCLGVNIMASHGEERNLENAIKDYALMYNAKIDLFISGHLHSRQTGTIGINQDGLDIEHVRVKSICGIDNYSVRLRKSSGAGASLFVIEEGKGKTIMYDINLQII